jgi:hypothetical protein
VKSLNKVISLSLVIVITTIAVVYSKNDNQVQNTTSQEPQYITQAKKDIIGVWYAEENPTYIWEFKENGTLVSRSDGNPARIQTFKIVNTTPICGQDVDVDEKRETMYLVTKGEDGFEECSLMYFGENSKTEVYFWSVGMTVDATRGFIKKSKTRVEKF